MTPRLARPDAAQDLDLVYGTSNEDARIATAALFRDEARRLVGLLLLVTGDRAMAEDLAQEAFVRMHAAWPRLQSRDRATAYLRSTALNLARSRWRRLGIARRFRPEPQIPADAADLVAERNEERARNALRFTILRMQATYAVAAKALDSVEAVEAAPSMRDAQQAWQSIFELDARHRLDQAAIDIDQVSLTTAKQDVSGSLAMMVASVTELHEAGIEACNPQPH